MHERLDSPAGQLLADEIASVDPDDELVPDRQGAGRGAWQDQIGALGEVLEVLLSQSAPAFIPLLESLELDSKHRGLNLGRSITIEDDTGYQEPRRPARSAAPSRSTNAFRPAGSVSYFNHRSVPSITNDTEPISHRFSDRTITQACTLLLREAGKPLHVNELYNLLVAGGMQFKGNNPTISIAVSLNRNRRFRKVEPGTFDLVIREASQQIAS